MASVSIGIGQPAAMAAASYDSSRNVQTERPHSPASGMEDSSDEEEEDEVGSL
jgi:hypothetical protein